MSIIFGTCKNNDTADGNCTGEFYLNGVLKGQGTSRSRHSGALAGANLGSCNDGTANFADTTIDGFIVYNYAIDPNEIALLLCRH